MFQQFNCPPSINHFRVGLKLGTRRSVNTLPDYRQLHEEQENSNKTAHTTHLLIIKKCTGRKKIIISVINFAAQPQNREQSGQFIGILAGGDKAKNNNS